MKKKPVIGLNADFREASKEMPAFTYITAGYYDAVTRVGGIPLILPPCDDENDVHVLLDMIDGLIMVGGADLDPRRDGFMLHPTVRTLATRREAFDRALVRLAVDRQMPIFGVGVGMQLLNIVRGGNLFLHIPEDLSDALPHKDPQDPAHRHGLEVVPGSLMERVFGDGELRVNSMHHMAIDEVAADFQVTARCPDGVIEAIESTTPDWFAIGTQFHPEADSASALDLRIFEEFLLGITGEVPEVRLVA
jgi:putative glutamine amidotransferase